MTEPTAIPDDDLEIALVQLTFDANAAELLLPVLSKYVVMTRNQPACRNVDLCVSFTDPNHFVIIEKWDSEEAARAHFDSAVMVEMAESCSGILAHRPDVDLLEGVSAHDLN
jgi:quinol monooxygenase YgiN